MNDKQFRKTTDEGLHLVQFHASWIGMCFAMESVIESLTVQYQDILNVFTVDVEEDTRIIARLGVKTCPCSVLIHDGKTIGMRTGYQSQESLQQFINESLPVNQSL